MSFQVKMAHSTLLNSFIERRQGRKFDSHLRIVVLYSLINALSIFYREVAKRARTLGCDAFIVGVTGNVFPEDVDFFKYNGADCVLPKPIHMDYLERLWVERGLV